MTDAGSLRDRDELIGRPIDEAVRLGQDVDGPVLDERTATDVERIIARYPERRSALVPLLYLVQSVVGWVPRQGMREVASILGLTTSEVEAVATFYTMLKLHPCGRYVLSICTNPSCALAGGKRLLEHADETLGETARHVTPDGLFSVEEEECMAACDHAPVMSVNYVYFDRVDPGAFDAIVAGVRAGDVAPAARGGVPGELKEISRLLAGLGEEPGPSAAPEAEAAHG